MHLGRVRGTVVASTRSPGLDGVKFLWVQPMDPDGNEYGEPVVCADATGQAGYEELVYFVGGREAAVALEETFVPVDHTVVGIVDHVEGI